MRPDEAPPRESNDPPVSDAESKAKTQAAVGRRRVLQAVGVTTGAMLGGSTQGIIGRVQAQAESDGSWSQQQKLTAADGDPEDRFGSAVALDGTGSTAVVGAAEDDDEVRGSAYVFARRTDEWTQQAKLLPDGFEYNRFGRLGAALNRDGDTAVVGAPTGINGRAYVFVRQDDEWTQQARLTPDGSDRGKFGESLALSGAGDTLIVGARQAHSNGEDAGSTYVFVRRESEWMRQAKIVPEDVDAQDEFGSAVALDQAGETAVVGARNDEDPTPVAGSVYVFVRRDGEWIRQAKLTPDSSEVDDFGFATALDRDGATAVVGAPQRKASDGRLAGSAYVFEDTGSGEWVQRAELVPDDPTGADQFGRVVALDNGGETVLAGAYDDEAPGATRGSAYVFARDVEWAQQQALLDEDDEDNAGTAVALDETGGTAIVGAPFGQNADGETAGSAYVFEDSGTEGGGGGSGDPVDEYDEDGDGRIDNRELLDALADYDGDAPREEASVNNRELLELLAEYTAQ